MRAIEISQKTHLIRHWFKWYRVQRGGTDWQRLKIEKRIPPMNLNKVARDLQKKYGGGGSLPPILDEKAADEEVKKNTPKKVDKKAKA
jgi:hypothetical protein